MTETTPITTAPTPPPSQPAAPQAVVKKENSLWAFGADHWGIVIVAIVGLSLFFILPHFQELAYGLARIAIAVLFIVVTIYAWFRQTVREYLVSGAFVAEFRALLPHHRVAVTMTIVILISWIVVECLVHP